MRVPTSLLPIYRLYAVLGGAAFFGCSMVFWNVMLQ